MADNLYFSDVLNLTSGVGTTTLSGRVGIDYDSLGATGGLDLSAFGKLGAQSFTKLTLAPNGFDAGGIPRYVLTGTNSALKLLITYVGQTPSSAIITVTDLADTTLAGGTGNVDVVCFAAGTRLRTSRGDIAVEQLKKDDEVITASGARRKIVWIGNRAIDCRRHPDPRAVMPIRIAKDAFGPGKPARDLSVSPGHGICVAVLDEVLIPAALLLNGTTVTQVDVEDIVYWHVALESHDIVLAEGLPTESHIDVATRASDSGSATRDDHCRPYVTDEGITRAVRARLQARARKLGWRLDEAPEAKLAIVADGKTILPEMGGKGDGLLARFALPAATNEAWLVSETTVPAFIRDTWDGRRLGACVRSLAIGTGTTLREISIDDPKLSVGFHYAEGTPGTRFRWTTGRALLPAAAWRGMGGTVQLEVRLAVPPLPRWTAPPARGDEKTAARPSLVSSAA